MKAKEASVNRDEKAVRISAFSFAYPDGSPLLREVSHSFAEGTFTLLVGKTGSGKTTLLRSIKPELAPIGNKSGVIEVFGEDISTLDIATSSTLIAYVAQNPENQVVCDTVWHELAFGLENLGVSHETMRRRVAEVAHFFGIEPWMHARTAHLSGGQKQVLNLASALVMQAKVLLLDEPTAQLDPVAEKNFLHALFRINRELGITVVVATHSPEAMSNYASDALCLHNGQLSHPGIDEFSYSKLSCSFLEKKEDPRQTPLAIEVNDGYYRYSQNGPWVLRGIDFTVSKGSIHAIVGGNGSGKTTLLRGIAGALKLQRGKIKNTFLSNQALLPQDPKALFVGDSVGEELAEWQKHCGYSDGDIESMVQIIGLESHLEHHPYDLSGGQQQKLALAKLLLTQPELLLLDEPTKGLDARAKSEMAKTLLRLRDQGITQVLVTHDLAFTLAIADKVTMLFDGEAACTESAAEFFTQNLFYRPQPDEFLHSWQREKIGIRA